jgi:hypothetical protein
MTEAALTNKIRLAIKERGAFVWKSRGDPRQTKGIPDLTMCYAGYFIAMEIKLPGKEKTLTRNQAETLKRIRAAGGIAEMVTSKAQAMQILDSIEDELT